MIPGFLQVTPMIVMTVSTGRTQFKVLVTLPSRTKIENLRCQVRGNINSGNLRKMWTLVQKLKILDR